VSPPLEIGRSLREARLARGATLEAVEAKTRIRTRYLKALEDERFDDLPGEAYAKGFLRTYADHLGLDGQECLNAYRAQRRLAEEPPFSPRVQRPYEAPRTGIVLAAGVAVVLVTALGLAAWRLGDDGQSRQTGSRPAVAQPAPVLTLTATGKSRLEVRLRNERGRRLWSGALRRGQHLRLGLGRPIWMEASAPGRLRLVVGGKQWRLPATASVVTVRGARPA
jgi:hypothetical protein